MMVRAAVPANMIFAIFMAVSRFLGMQDKPRWPDWFPQLTQSAPRGMLPQLAHRAAVGSARMIVLTQMGHVPRSVWRLTIWVPEEQAPLAQSALVSSCGGCRSRSTHSTSL